MGCKVLIELEASVWLCGGNTVSVQCALQLYVLRGSMHLHCQRSAGSLRSCAQLHLSQMARISHLLTIAFVSTTSSFLVGRVFNEVIRYKLSVQHDDRVGIPVMEPSVLPLDFDCAVTQAVNATLLCIQSGQNMCRIDFDTTINDQTYTSIKSTHPFLTELLKVLSSTANFTVTPSTADSINSTSQLTNSVHGQIVRATRILVFYPDTGAAALARRDWKLDSAESLLPTACIHTGSMEYDDLDDHDTLAILLCPQSSEVDYVSRVMRMCEERQVPCVLINPQLINMDQGFGVRARNIRKTVLDRFETSYKLKTLPMGALVRTWPGAYSLWKEDKTQADGYSLLKSFATEPTSNDISALCNTPCGIQLMYYAFEHAIAF